MPDLPLADRHETVLPPAPDEVRTALLEAQALDPERRKTALESVVGDHPEAVGGWAQLATLGATPVERYAYARVGYHRGLDALRAHGWGGTGLVRWSRPANRPFLACLVRLRAAAEEIGEAGEVARITAFLDDLDAGVDEAAVASWPQPTVGDDR
jgi:hypothetical protein